MSKGIKKRKKNINETGPDLFTTCILLFSCPLSVCSFPLNLRGAPHLDDFSTEPVHVSKLINIDLFYITGYINKY